MRFDELRRGLPYTCGKEVFCRLHENEQDNLRTDYMVFVLGTGRIEHISVVVGPDCLERDDYSPFIEVAL